MIAERWICCSLEIDQNQRDGERSAQRVRTTLICCSILSDRRSFKKKITPNGGVAQLGEHLPCKQGVMGSNPIISTTRQCREPSSTNEARTTTPRMRIERARESEARFERTRYTEDDYMGS